MHNYQWAAQQCSILAEVGTLHMEWKYLSELTGDPQYGQLVCFIFFDNHLIVLLALSLNLTQICLDLFYFYWPSVDALEFIFYVCYTSSSLISFAEKESLNSP